jgi:enoyl-CoA hydratase/carnithine racemase
VIVLNRPDVLNAIDLEVMDRLAKEMDGFLADAEIRAIAITGRGRAFSAGADIRALAERSPEGQREFMVRAHGMMDRLEAAAKPVIAAVNGVAAGGGFEMMLACDLAIAVESVRIGLTEIRYGFLPGGGGTQRLPRWVSPAVAKRLIWSGELLSAEEARTLGLVLQVVKDGELMPAVEALAGQVARWSPAAVAEAKALVNGARARPLHEGLAAEREANVRLLSSPEAVAAMEAFLTRGKSR